MKVFYYRIVSPVSLIVFKIKWRLKNRHNFTDAKVVFPTELVFVGDKSYGPLEVYSFGANNEGLKIGHFVSIASDVKFILGGNHMMDTVSTYPFKRKLFSLPYEAVSKGKIIIGDDVWIGIGSVILSGVTIGQGCVIAAGSVVTHSFPPYSVVGGNPAKIIRMRFEPTIIERLMQLSFKHLDVSCIADHLELFYSKIVNVSDVMELEKFFREN